MPELVLEGTWEEVSRRAEDLAGKHVRVTVLDDMPDAESGVPADRRWRSPEEHARAFIEWAESHPHDTPLLSDEAISRESIYSPDP